MMLTRVFLLLSFILICGKAFSYGTGIVTHPLEAQKKLITSEVTGVVSNGAGAGVQARYLQKIRREWSFEAGAGFAGGERSNRIFAGTDYEFFADTGYQPRFSTKAYWINSSEFNTRTNNLGVAPMVSKGFMFWDVEAYPFVALPMELSLNSDTKSYEVQSRLAFGVTAPIPVKSLKKFIANLEANVNMANSYSAVFAGVTYPFN